MVHAVKVHGGVEVLPRGSLTWCWMEVNGHHCAPAALLQGTECHYTLSRSLCGPVDPHGWSEWFAGLARNHVFVHQLSSL